ncbi:MAG: hypothetical protein HZC29_02145 [Thaumarchaeota archaeon]|nr:hypothetical protein [Nitrososphaerota archaeon]
MFDFSNFLGKQESRFWRYYFTKRYGYDPIHAEIKHSRWTIAVWKKEDILSQIDLPRHVHDGRLTASLEKLANEFMDNPNTTIKPKQRLGSFQFESKLHQTKNSLLHSTFFSDKQRQLEVLDNILVNAGMTKSGKLNTGETTGGWTHIEVGRGSTAEQLTDTALQTTEKRKAFTSGGNAKVPTGTQTEKYSMVWYDTDMVSALPVTLYEAGIFDASSSGNMYCRITFSGKQIASGDLMTSQINVTSQNGTVV